VSWWSSQHEMRDGVLLVAPHEVQFAHWTGCRCFRDASNPAVILARRHRTEMQVVWLAARAGASKAAVEHGAARA
jgi:hypothetical protein